MTTETADKPGLGGLARTLLWGGIATLLALPAIAMLFTTQVNWGSEDFAAAAFLLVGAGLALEVSAKVLTSPAKRVLAAVAIVAGLLLVWAELAVGIFD